MVAAVERREDLREVEVGQDQARHEDQLRHRVEVLGLDVGVEPEEAPHRQHEHRDHREAGEDRAVDEERREERRVPARDQRHREVPGHDAVHRQDQRRRERREQAVRAPVVPPLVVRALPAQRQHRVDAPPPARRGVAERGDVGHEAHDEEDRADAQVGRDREHVPRERRAEVRPQVTLVGVRQHEVREPDAPGVDHREEAGGQDREDRHRLRRAVNGRPPARTEEVEDRRDQRARVPDADPEHERRDVERPHLRDALARHADAPPDLARPRQDAAREDQGDDAHPGEVAVARRLERAEDVAVDVGEGRGGGRRAAHGLTRARG